jgi:hypothetical protein
MLVVRRDEDCVSVPAAKNPFQPARGREEQSIRGEWDYFEWLGDRRVSRLTRIATRRHRQMYVAIGRHEQRYLRTPFGDAAAGSRKETGGARPFASSVKK